MKRILIAKDLAYAAKIGGGTIAGINEINQLDAGAIALFTENNRLLTAVNANTVFTTLPDTKAIYIAVGSGNALLGAKLSGLIDRMSINVIKETYVAPVKERKFIGNDGATGSFNLPSPLVVGSEALIRITDNTTGTNPPDNQKRYSYVVRTGDTTVEIAAGLNTDMAAADCPYTVSVIGAGLGLQLDAKNYGVTCEISLDGVLADSTVEEGGVSNSIAIVYGKGTDYQVAALEFETNPVEGDTNRVYMPQKWFSKATDVVVGGTYDMYAMTWVQSHTRAIGATVSAMPTIILFIPTGAATIPQADLETVLTEAFGVLRVNTETGA